MSEKKKTKKPKRKQTRHYVYSRLKSIPDWPQCEAMLASGRTASDVARFIQLDLKEYTHVKHASLRAMLADIRKQIPSDAEKRMRLTKDAISDAERGDNFPSPPSPSPPPPLLTVRGKLRGEIPTPPSLQQKGLAKQQQLSDLDRIEWLCQVQEDRIVRGVRKERSAGELLHRTETAISGMLSLISESHKIKQALGISGKDREEPALSPARADQVKEKYGEKVFEAFLDAESRHRILSLVRTAASAASRTRKPTKIIEAE